MKQTDSGKHPEAGRHRAGRRRRTPYGWLGAGAVTLGLGAALASGSAVAYADTGTGSGAGRASADSSESGSTAAATNDSAPAKNATAHSARRSSVTSSGGNVTGRTSSAVVSSNAPAAAAVSSEPVASHAEAASVAVPGSSAGATTGHSARVRTTSSPSSSGSDTSDTSSAAAAAPAADPSPNMTSWLPSTPIVAGVAVNLAQQQIAEAQSLLTQQTWGSGNVVAGLTAIVPQILLAQAALSFSTWETATPATQAFYANTAGIPIVHQAAGVTLLGALLLPTLAGVALNSTALLLPLVGAFEGTGAITSVENLVATARQNGQVYGLVPVTMKSTTEPIVYISVNGGPSVPVLVDTGSSGLVLTRASVGNAAPLGSPTGSGSSSYTGGLSYSYKSYTTTVDFGNGIVSEPTSVNIVDEADAAKALNFFNQLGGASGVLGIGANAAGPGPSIPTTALPGELSDGVFLYQSLFFGVAGVMVFGPNPLPVRTSVSGAPDAYLKVKINNGTTHDVGAIIDSGGVYGTMLTSVAGQSIAPGSTISVYTPDGILLYSYTVTSATAPTLISSGLINTGYMPFQLGPVYVNYTAPNGIGSTDFDYA